MLSVVTNEQAREELGLVLDEIVCEGARRLLAAAWRPRSTAISPPTRPSGTDRAGVWWYATAMGADGRS